ncbi:signal peptidase I [Candidatus Peregrinibacteria bacterium]|nr:signal peptidase I [Candidatus Peregrinibacteria bacterium]
MFIKNFMKKEKKGKILKFLEKKINNTSLSNNQKKNFIFTADIIINLIVIVALVLFIRTFLISPFQVFGVSMCNTFNYHNERCIDSFGDYIIINKSAYLELPGYTVGKPERGDVIVFHPPQNPNQFYIKRIIGLPEETIKLIDGDVYLINEEHPTGIKLEEPYLSNENRGKTFALDEISEFDIPSGKYLVLGDNRTKSSDSRSCFKDSFGAPGCDNAEITPYLSINNIEGKAAIVLWPNPRIIYSHDYQEIK